MMEMVNGSRFGVALMGLGIHRRSFLEAAIYAGRRSQFGQRIDRYPLVRETLVDMAVDLEAGLGGHLRVRLGHAHGARPRVGTARASHPDPPGQDALHPHRAPDRRRRHSRSSAATATWRTGRWPASCRDAQCHTIWEGTENILCIDVRRAMRGEQAHVALLARVERALDAAFGVGGTRRSASTRSQQRSRTPGPRSRIWKRWTTISGCCTRDASPSFSLT